MKEVRCKQCKRLLCKLIKGTVEVKCPRCKIMNLVTAKSYQQECQRASSMKGITHAEDDSQTAGLS